MVSKKNRPRRSAEETRRILTEEGLRELQATGMIFGLEHLTLEAACAVTNVPRSSSHAAWSLDDEFTPQTLYQRSVLRQWLDSRDGSLFTGAAEKALAAAFERHGDTLSRSDIIRVAMQAALEAGLNERGESELGGLTSSDMAIKHALASQPEHHRDPEITEWIRQAENRHREGRVADTYRPMAAMLGLRPRAEYGDEAFGHMAVAVASLHEGIAMRELITPEHNLARASIRDQPDDAIAATLIGVCVEALVEKFFESDPDATTSFE